MTIEQDFKTVWQRLHDDGTDEEEAALSRIEGWCNERQGMNDALTVENERLRGREIVWQEMEKKYADALNENDRLRKEAAQRWEQHTHLRETELEAEVERLRHVLMQIADSPYSAEDRQIAQQALEDTT